MYENKDFLDSIDRNYQKTKNLYAKTFGPVIVIDGTMSQEDVHTAITDRLAEFLPR